MKIFTAHLKPLTEPVLVREGFSWGAFLFGPLWLAARRAWIPAGLVLAALVLADVLMPNIRGVVLDLGAAFMLGLMGRDLQRWSLEQRGYLMTHVLAARDEDEAWMRLLNRRPDLAQLYLSGQA